MHGSLLPWYEFLVQLVTLTCKMIVYIHEHIHKILFLIRRTMRASSGKREISMLQDIDSLISIGHGEVYMHRNGDKKLISRFLFIKHI